MMPEEPESLIAGSAHVARLYARPLAGTRPAPVPGLHSVAQTNGREGYLYVPAGRRSDRPGTLIVALHGGGGDARRGLDRIVSLADEFDAIVFAPQSFGTTWDLIVGGFGPDVAVIDAALADIFARYAVDAERLALAGFSDGASYALSLGIANGDLFKHIMAFSPAFADPPALVGEPRLFISHGTQDRVLTIDESSRTVVRVLSRVGYDIHYEEFDGPHTIPEQILRDGYEWFLGDAAGRVLRGG